MVNRKYTFDVKLFATIHVTAASEQEARKWIRENIDGASANLGSYPDGNPIVTNVTLDDEPENDELVEIDGEAV